MSWTHLEHDSSSGPSGSLSKLGQDYSVHKDTNTNKPLDQPDIICGSQN